MIYIHSLQPVDIAYIIGTWNGIMGGDGHLCFSRRASEIGADEL